MLKSKLALIAGGMTLLGAIGGTALMVSAQTAPTTTAPATVSASTSGGSASAVDTPESANDPADTDTNASHGHAPLGGDGVVSSISGTTLVIGEESDEGGASYTVDASKASVTNKGAAATLADIKVGDKVFVQGTVSGTNVAATSVSLGHPGRQGDNDGNAASEANEGSSSSDTSDQ